MKTVLITGASRGLGKSIAVKFAENNYNIVINYNNSKNEALELERYIKDNYQVEVITIKADVGNEIEVKNMFNEIINKFNVIDIVVNNIKFINYFIKHVFYFYFISYICFN